MWWPYDTPSAPILPPATQQTLFTRHTTMQKQEHKYQFTNTHIGKITNTQIQIHKYHLHSDSMHTVHSSYNACWKYKNRLRWKFCELVLYCVFGHGKVLKSWKLNFFFKFLFHCNTFQICDTFTHWCQWDLSISTERKIWFLGIFCLHSLYVSYIGGWYLVPVTNHHVFESISPHNHNHPDQCDHHHPDLTGQS